jgi:hypothetical protein
LGWHCPYTSTDNPYSEAQFKMLKYRPAFPARFDSIEHARAFCRDFFAWYHHDHRHSEIGLMTPATVHHGRAEALHADRARVLDAAYTGTPNASSATRRDHQRLSLSHYNACRRASHPRRKGSKSASPSGMRRSPSRKLTST